MIRALTVGLAVVVAASMFSGASLSAEPEVKRKMRMILTDSSKKPGGVIATMPFPGAQVPSPGLYGVSGLAQRSYQQDRAKKGVRKVPTGKNKYIEYRKTY